MYRAAIDGRLFDERSQLGGTIRDFEIVECLPDVAVGEPEYRSGAIVDDREQPCLVDHELSRRIGIQRKFPQAVRGEQAVLPIVDAWRSHGDPVSK